MTVKRIAESTEFTKEDHDTQILRSKPKEENLDPHMPYSECFNAVFGVFGVGGFIVIVVVIGSYIK